MEYISITGFFVITYMIFKLKNIYPKIKIFEDKLIDLNKKYAPIVELDCLKKQAEKKYTNLQHEYKSNFDKYKNEKSLIACYKIGIGTVDSKPFEPISKNLSIEDRVNELNVIKNKINSLIKSKTACVCSTNWLVNNRKAEGTKFSNRMIRLSLRCFDNECKAALVQVARNNINRLVNRIELAFEDINGAGEISTVKIQHDYCDLRIRELCLHHEQQEALSIQKEETRIEKQHQREVEREKRNIEAAAIKATRDRENMEKLIQIEAITLNELFGGELEQLKTRINEQNKELATLKEKEKRAMSMAQQTRAGYVYVISNKNSFGDRTTKIGMTRRVNPFDRVKELGDASVPFLFNAHAMIYTEDAPKLEKYLHAAFSDKRVNLINYRKEFFFVSSEEVLLELENFQDSIEIERFNNETLINSFKTL